jgi:hypothetical protein
MQPTYHMLLMHMSLKEHKIDVPEVREQQRGTSQFDVHVALGILHYYIFHQAAAATEH